MLSKGSSLGGCGVDRIIRLGDLFLRFVGLEEVLLCLLIHVVTSHSSRSGLSEIGGARNGGLFHGFLLVECFVELFLLALELLSCYQFVDDWLEGVSVGCGLARWLLLHFFLVHLHTWRQRSLLIGKLSILSDALSPFLGVLLLHLLEDEDGAALRNGIGSDASEIAVLVGTTNLRGLILF